jgi:hypothetical protein
MKCTNWGCPIHACMTPECQLEHVAQNNPHIIEKYGADIAGNCPRRKELEDIKKQLA